MEYIDPQKARQERERQERERQARIKAEKDRKAKIEAEKKRQAKIEAEKKRKAKLKAKKEAAQKAEEEATKKAKKAEHPDKKPTDPKLETKKPTEQKPENKKPQSEKKPDDKTQTEITWSKPGEASPIYGPSAPTYSSISSLYGQPSVPISKGSEAKPKPEVPSDRKARTWSGEKVEPQAEHKPYKPRELSGFKQEIAEGRAKKEQKKQEQLQHILKQYPGIQTILQQPFCFNSALALGAALTNPLMGATLLSGAQALGQPEKTHPSEPIKVASARVQGHGIITPDTPEQKLHHQFETNVAAKAQGLLKANKDRLNIDQKAYAQDNNPKSDRWSHLWQVASQRREFQTQQANLQQQYEFTTQEINRVSVTPDENTGRMATLQEIQNSAKQKKLWALDSQKKRLKERIAVAKQMQVSLEYAYPALAAVKGEMGANPQDIQAVQKRLPQEFDGIRGNIDKLSGEIRKDPSTALLFDSVVTDALRKGGHNQGQMKELSGWLEQERGNKERLSQLGMAVGGGLFLASFVPQLRGGAALLKILGAGTMSATFAYDLPDLLLLDAAAQSGRGGAGKLTGQSPEQARFNLVMGYANVALAGLDVGAEMKVIRGLERLMGHASLMGAQVLRQTWVQVMSLSRQGEAGLAKARVLLMKAKGVPQSMVDEVMEVLSPAQEMVGVGKVSRSEMRGQTAEVTTQEALKKAKASGQKKLKDMNPTERLAYSQNKYGQAKNWDEVEPLIGKTVNQNTQLPPGYVFYEKPAKRGARQLFILRENADDGSLVTLMIENGKIQAGKTRLSRDAMKANLKAVGIDVPKDWQVNHLIPDEIAQSNPLMIEMLKRDIYDVDRASNLLPMPGDAAVRKANPNLMGHQGSHGDYSRLISRELTDEKTRLVAKYNDLSKIPDSELSKAVGRAENRARKRILENDPSIPTRVDPKTGTKVISDAALDDQELVG